MKVSISFPEQDLPEATACLIAVSSGVIEGWSQLQVAAQKTVEWVGVSLDFGTVFVSVKLSKIFKASKLELKQEFHFTVSGIDHTKNKEFTAKTFKKMALEQLGELLEKIAQDTKSLDEFVKELAT